MSFLSTTENVGFTGIPQSISETSCATQYKMGVEGVSGSGDMNMFIHDSSGDEQNYIPHLNDNFFHTKFKIDPNDLYTFHDSDVIAGEITVSHTEDSFVFQEDVKSKLIEDSIKHEDDILTLNGDIKEEIKTDVILNGHQPAPKTAVSVKISNVSKTTNAKVPKIKNQIQASKEQNIPNAGDKVSNVQMENSLITPSSCNATGSNKTNNGQTAQSSKLGLETFLDVFKREQGVVAEPDIKTEPSTTPMKHIISTSKKTPAAKTASQSKPKRGRGPTVHEALQRIPPQSRVVAVKNSSWHAPGQELYSCGPLDEQHGSYLKQDSSSSDDDYMPDFDLGNGPACVEETAAESRGARLALRRAALRRHVASVHTELRLASDLKRSKVLVSLIKKQLKQCNSPRLPPATVNYLLTGRAMPALLSSRERRQLRRQGWSGGAGASSAAVFPGGGACGAERCGAAPLPCSRHCARHAPAALTLLAACVCRAPAPADHDNLDKSRDSRVKKPSGPRRPPARAAPPEPPAPRPRILHNPRRPPATKEVSVCPSSPTYDSSEDPALGGYTANDTQELDRCSEGDGEIVEEEVLAEEVEEEVGEGAAGAGDDLLDPAVLSQIPDVAFTEFFNQAEGGPAFAESSELAAALEAVLDEDRLDTMEYSAYSQIAKNKIPVATSVSMELSSSAPS